MQSSSNFIVWFPWRSTAVNCESCLPPNRATVADVQPPGEPSTQTTMIIPSTKAPTLMDRQHILQDLARRPSIHHDDPAFWHGRGCFGQTLPPPELTWKCKFKPRDDHGDVASWLTASHYQDTDEVTDRKAKALVQLLKVSNKTVVYSGAGISCAAGIGQAARGAPGSAGGNKTTTALPTITHYALTALYEHGLLHGWVQQNHDGLPQKAGFPQEHINEVHGSWYDPSNPVVLYSGDLRSTECDWMEREAASADLVVVLGTSLGGLNADQVAHRTADRSRKGKSLGTVMINPQQTMYDGETTIRFFGTSDAILTKVLHQLKIPFRLTPPRGVPQPTRRRVLVPYDAEGQRSETIQMWLDLSPGARIQITHGHNFVGAQQPGYAHIVQRLSGGSRGRRGRLPQGSVRRWNDATAGIELVVEGTGMLLGQWWVEAAQRGGLDSLPVVNIHPETVISKHRHSRQESKRKSGRKNRHQATEP